MTLQEMRDKHKAALAAARVMIEAKIESGKDWEDGAEKKYNDLKASADLMKSNIDEFLDLNDLEDVTEPVAAVGTAHGIEVGHKPVYKNVGEQLLDIRAMSIDNSSAPAARERFQKVVNESGLKTGVDSEGGYLIETDKSKEIIQTSVETGVLSSRCVTQPIGGDSDGFEYFAANDRDRSAGVFLGGVRAYRKAESEEMTKWATANIDPREIKLHDQYALLKVTNRMLRDNVALTGLVKNAVPKAFAFLDDKEIFEGTGSGQHLGVMNSDVKIAVAKESGQTAKTIVAKNIINMWSRFYGNINNAAWFVNQDCTPQLPFLTIGDQPIFVPGGTFANAPYGVLLGRPIVPIEHCETLGTEGDIMLGDFSQYMRITKGGVEEAESIHVRFLTDEKVFRWIKRNNGQPIHDEPITPLKGSATLSPFVTLAVRA
jgi:HK97 family phage major capsid protein